MPGLVVVAAITDDFALNVLQQKNDRLKISEKLRAKGDTRSFALAAMAESGMKLIDGTAITLMPPNDDSLAASYRRLRDLYRMAYAVDPSDAFEPERGAHRQMRSYVRRWITRWDLERGYPGQEIDLDETRIAPTYDEDDALGTDSEEGGSVAA